jgi:hypothetical protein
LLRDDWAQELISYGLKQLNSYGLKELISNEVKYLRAMGLRDKTQAHTKKLVAIKLGLKS